MRTINGYVCVASLPGMPHEKQILFGPGEDEQSQQNFETNNLTSYSTLTEAIRGQDQLKKRKAFSSVQLAKVSMTLAETIEELEGFDQEDSLVVIMNSKPIGQLCLIGHMVEGKPGQYPLPGAKLIDNGYTPFESLEMAKYVCGEVQRQARCPGYIATFHLGIV